MGGWPLISFAFTPFLNTLLATAVKLCRPECAVMGVEPQTADTMARSLEAGAAVTLTSASSIAAGLAPPFAGENAFR